jgi:hypothetical protein
VRREQLATVVTMGAVMTILQLWSQQHMMVMSQWRILILMAAMTISAHVGDTPTWDYRAMILMLVDD